MDGLTAVVGLAAASIAMLWAKKRQTSEPQVAFNSVNSQAFPADFKQLIQGGAERNNPVQNLSAPLNSAQVGADIASAGEKTVDVRNALHFLKTKPTNTAINLQVGARTDFGLNTEKIGSALADIRFCSTHRTANLCDAFDNKQFADNCGMCHANGTDPNGRPMNNGGLQIQSVDRKAAKAKSRGRRINYQPSVGSCNPTAFSTTKAECIRLENKIACMRNQSFDVPNCSQCTSDGSFTQIDPSASRNTAKLVLAGQGLVTISKNGQNIATDAPLSEDGSKIPLSPFLEGDTVTIVLKANPSAVSAPRVGGYISGNTVGGEYKTDITRLIKVDNATGKAPRRGGNVYIDDDAYTTFTIASITSKNADLSFVNPQTFLDPSEPDAEACPTAPFATKSTSASNLSANVCYKKGEGPGAYSLDCLKATFLQAGGTTSGTGQPTTQEKANTLMSPQGTPLPIAEIAQNVYDLVQIATTGKDRQGADISTAEWNQATMFIMGKSIAGPCDEFATKGGNVSPQCLEQLYKNTGSLEGFVNVGATQTAPPQFTSLLKNRALQGCQPEGLASPIKPDGTIRQSAVDQINSTVGWDIDRIKKYYNDVHKYANDNTLPDDIRFINIALCYGTAYVPRKPTIPDVPPSAAKPLPTCEPETIITNYAQPGSNLNQWFKSWNKVNFDEHQIFRATFTLNGPPKFGGSVNLIHFTQTEGIGRTAGDYVLSVFVQSPDAVHPGYWFAIVIENTWFQLDHLNQPLLRKETIYFDLGDPIELIINKVDPFNPVIIYRENTPLEFKLKIPNLPQQPRSLGLTKVETPGRLFTPINGLLQNASFCSFGANGSVRTNAIIDNPSARQFSSFKLPPAPPFPSVLIQKYSDIAQQGTSGYTTNTDKLFSQGDQVVNKDWELQFFITPRSKVNDWAGIVRLSLNEIDVTKDWVPQPKQGTRMPGIWFWPNTTRLHIVSGDPTDWNWNINPPAELPVGSRSSVKITARGRKVTVTINSVDFDYTQPTDNGRAVGVATCQSPCPGWPAANATVEDLRFGTVGIDEGLNKAIAGTFQNSPNFTGKAMRVFCDGTTDAGFQDSFPKQVINGERQAMFKSCRIKGGKVSFGNLNYENINSADCGNGGVREGTPITVKCNNQNPPPTAGQLAAAGQPQG